MKFRIILPTLYGILYVASFIVLLVFREKTPLAGVWAIMLTTPWSTLLPMLLGTIGAGLFQNMWFGYISTILSALLNGFIYFFTGWGIDSWLASRKQ